MKFDALSTNSANGKLYIYDVVLYMISAHFKLFNSILGYFRCFQYHGSKKRQAVGGRLPPSSA